MQYNFQDFSFRQIVTTAAKVGGIINVTSKQLNDFTFAVSRGMSVDSILNFQFNSIPTEVTNLIYARGSCRLKFDVETAAPQGRLQSESRRRVIFHF